jgi:hypothetical protein
MPAELTTMASVQEKVKDRIQTAFLDLIPPEMWDQMVSQHINEFVKNDLPKLVKEEGDKLIRKQIAAEFSKPEWAETWGSASMTMGPTASKAVKEIVQQCAPELMAGLFGGLVQNIVLSLRNAAQQRGY